MVTKMTAPVSVISSNPFEFIYNSITDTYSPITVEFLLAIYEELKEFSILEAFKSYSDILDMLEYLEVNNVINLRKNEDGSIDIKRAY